ncbi:unnamed protein product [Caenorhabditis angaria]|uniref:PH domain-containing protein n=1 Tax=Caenorhabditis angaria TaxID=860376 RepID=A0A9P1MWY6_9PELO|nr:unnamed protein product [Caenorhabditis angaria]
MIGNKNHPPTLYSPPPASSPFDSNKSYRWTSTTAAKMDYNKTVNESQSKPEQYRFKTNTTINNNITPEKKKADTSWLSPSRGDTWRLSAPRGRTRDLAAAFDQIAKSEVLGFSRLEHPTYGRRQRRNSEPNYENELKEVAEPNYIDDSMIQEFEDEEFEEYRDINSDFFERQTLADERRTESEAVEIRENRQSTSSFIHRSTAECIIRDNGDMADEVRYHHPIDVTPKRPNNLNNRANRNSLEPFQNKFTDGIVTSTPNVDKEHNEIKKYFGNEETIKASPLSRRDRRATQAIVIPAPEFDSPASEKKFKVPNLPKSNVKSIAGEFEKADFGFHRKIDAASEIQELRRKAAEKHEQEIDENQNIQNSSQESVPRVGHKEMRPSVRMGINSYNSEGEDRAWCERENEDFYAIPNKSNKLSTNDETDESRLKMLAAKRQSLPFSDIPEERTYDKIDEMFDFVEKTDDYEEKTLEHTNGYAEIQSSVKIVSSIPKNITSTTYQELDFDRSTTAQFENDGTGGSGGSGPQFTRSPTLMTPHAGQSVTEYRVSEKEGLAKTEKIVVNKMLQPSALATSTPKGTVAARKGGYSSNNNIEDDSFVSSISNVSTAEKINDSRRQISNLIGQIEETRKHIQLAEIALIDAKKSRLVVQELSAQRVLLLCRERLALQLDEVRRLQALSVVRHPPPPVNRHFKSTMIISNIAVHLNKNFNCRGSFAFIVALKCRTKIEATGVVTLFAHYKTRQNVIHFGENLHFSKLPVDFVITMEVYMMRVPEHKIPEKTCVSVFAAKCRNLLVPSAAHRRNTTNRSKNRTILSLPENYEKPACDFKFCGKLTLDRDSAGDRNFYLDDITYPLEGTVKVVSHCSSLPEAIDVMYRGYLYLYNEKSPNGDIAWEKYWALLNRGLIFFWKHPDDEKSEQIPLSQIDLTKCTNQDIDEVKKSSNFSYGRQFMFSIELLIDQTPTFLEKRRVLLAAENSDHLSSWLAAINDTLFVLRS